MGWPAPSGNIVGGTASGEGNYLSGLVIDGPAEGNIVIGNTVIGGVTVQGATRYGVIASNNRIGGPTPAERNVISGAGHYGEEGFPVGDAVFEEGEFVDESGTELCWCRRLGGEPRDDLDWAGLGVVILGQKERSPPRCSDRPKLGCPEETTRTR